MILQSKRKKYQIRSPLVIVPPAGCATVRSFRYEAENKGFLPKVPATRRPMARPTAWQAATGKHAERARAGNTIGKRSVPGDGRQTGNPKSPVDARETNLRRTTALYGRKVISVRRIRIARKPLPAYRRSIQRMKASLRGSGATCPAVRYGNPARLREAIRSSPIRRECDRLITEHHSRKQRQRHATATRSQSVPRRRPAATI